MSLFNNTWILTSTIGFITGFIFYLNSEKWVQFFTEKSLGVQKEILDIIDRLLITQDKKKIKRNSWIFTLGLSLIVFILVWPNVIMSLILSTIVFVGSWWFLKKIFQALWDKHRNKVISQMVEALTIMCNSLKVGLSLGQAMERVIKNYPGALAKEFALVLNKMKLGQNLEESLEEMAERIDKPEIDMLVSTVNILKETGGNLAETFFVMAETIRERQKMEKKIKALTAQGMMQAKIISALPFILIGILYFMDRNYIEPLLFKPLGWVCLAVVLVLVLIGGFLMKKMVEIKV